MKDFIGFLATAPLWTENDFGVSQFQFPHVDIDNFNLKEVPNNLRLGHRVEHVFNQLITYDPTYTVLAHNLQIKDGNITIGELDFLLQNTANLEILHVELSYKFYIIDPEIEQPIQQTMGPNRKDLFHSKLEKTKRNQFQLLRSDLGKRYLNDLDISAENITQQCCFIGQLFVPYKMKAPSIHPLNEASVVGYWLRINEFSEENFKKQQYYIPLKKEWIHIPHNEVSWFSHSECLFQITEFHNSERSPMVWVKRQNEAFEKFFAVWW